MQALDVDLEYVLATLRKLLSIPSPTGHTMEVARFVASELQPLGVPCQFTRRGALRATLPGASSGVSRAVAAHLDTLGAMVKRLKPNGRLEIVPVGNWSSRYAEGARVTILTDTRPLRGAILPLKASGHVYGFEVESFPISWENTELRVDEVASSAEDLERLGIQVGDFVAVDPAAEFTSSGFVCARHLDNKGGVAAVLGAARALRRAGVELPVPCHLFFSVSEEVGHGAAAGLPECVDELVVVDIAPQGEGQASRELGVTVALMDSAGPFDQALSRKLLSVLRAHDVPHFRDVFKFYRCDAAAALDAGMDLRTALLAFGVDASHGHERTHVSALRALADGLVAYALSPFEGRP